MDDYLLFIEDSEEDILLFEHMLAEQQFLGGTYSIYEGGEALAFLKEKGNKPPRMILLSLFLHDMEGSTVLEQLKDDPNLSHIPVVVWSGVNSQYKRELCERLGADMFVLKPMDITALQELAKDLIQFWEAVGSVN